MKIAITGHTSGLGKELFEQLSIDNDVIGFSRSTGYNIAKNKNLIVKESLGCDVFINNAYEMYGQLALFEEMYTTWKNDERKTIINIISLSKYPQILDQAQTRYALSKQALSKATLDAVFDDKRYCRVIAVNPGWIDTPRVKQVTHNKLTTKECAELIIPLLSLPDSLEIFEISLNKRKHYKEK